MASSRTANDKFGDGSDVVITLNSPVTSLSLSPKLTKAMQGLKVRSVKDLLTVDLQAVLELPGFSHVSLVNLQALKNDVISKLEGENPDKPNCLASAWTRAYGGLSVRTQNGLDRLSICTPQKFLELSEEQFLSQRGIGKKCWSEVYRAQVFLRPYIAECDLFENTNARLNLEDFPLFTGVEHRDEVVPDDFFPEAPVHSFVISTRGVAVLDDLGIKTMGDLLLTHEALLLKRKNCGKRTVLELKQSVKGYIAYNNAQSVPLDEKSFDELIGHLCREARLDQYIEIVQHRICQGQTLEQVGDTFGCQRERVRQIIELVTGAMKTYYKCKDILDVLINEIHSIVGKNRGIISFDSLGKEFSRSMEWTSDVSARGMREFLKTFSDLFDKYEVESGYVLAPHPCRGCAYIVDAFSDFVESEPSQSLDISTQIPLSTLCTRRNIWGCAHESLDYSAQFIRELADRSGLKISGGKIYSEKTWVLKKGGLNKKVEAILKQLGSIHTPEQVRTALSQHHEVELKKVHMALICSDNCLVWGRGEFIHRDNIGIDKDILPILRDILSSKLKNAPLLALPGIFSEYRETFIRARVPNEYALGTVVGLYLTDEFHIDRYHYVRPCQTDQQLSLTEQIDNWVFDQSTAVDVDYLTAHLAEAWGLRDSAISHAISRSEFLIPEKEKHIIHIENLWLRKDDLDPFRHKLNRLLSHHPRIGIYRVFNELEVLCTQLHIDNPRMLHAILSHYLSEEYVFGNFPHVNQIGASRSKALSMEISDYIAEKNGIVTLDECLEQFTRRGYSHRQTMYISQYALLNDVHQYYPKCFIHSRAIGWDEGRQKCLLQVLHESYLERIANGETVGDLYEVYDFYEAQLPPLKNGFGWTGHLLSSLSGKIPEVIMLGNARRAFSMQGHEFTFFNLGELVAYVVKNVFKGGCSREQLSEWMREHGVVERQLTQSMFKERADIIMTEYECLCRGNE